MLSGRSKTLHIDGPLADLREIIIHLHAEPRIGGAANSLFEPDSHLGRYTGTPDNDAVKLLTRNAEALCSIYKGQAQFIDISLYELARMAWIFHRHCSCPSNGNPQNQLRMPCRPSSETRCANSPVP